MRVSLPTKNPRISVCLSAREARELQDYAARHRHSRSWVARQAIVEFLERSGGPQGALPFRKGESGR